MPQKKPKPEETVSTLRQVDMMMSVAAAMRSIVVTGFT